MIDSWGYTNATATTIHAWEPACLDPRRKITIDGESQTIAAISRVHCQNDGGRTGVHPRVARQRDRRFG